MTDESRADVWLREHERALDYDLERHSDTCACEDCNQERDLRGLPRLQWAEPNLVQQSFDDDAFRIGEGDWESHWFHIARPERVNSEYL